MTTSNKREFVESPLVMGADEEIRWNLTITNWGGTPTSPAVKIYDPAGNDLSGTLMDGSATVSGNKITTPKIKDLTPGVRYRMEILFTSGGNTFEAYGYIKAEE